MDVRLPDGRIVSNVPEGITQSELLRKIGEYDSPKGSRKESNIGSLGSLKRGLEQGLTFGFGDEIKAGVAAPFGWLADKYYGSDRSLKDNYKDAKLDLENELEDAAQENPYIYNISEIAGGLLTGGGAVKSLPKALGSAKTFLGRRGREALLGATGGAVYGAGTAGYSDDLAQKTEEGAVSGALIAPILGGAFGAAGVIGNKLFKKTAPEVASKVKAEGSRLADEEGFITLKNSKNVEAKYPDRIYAESDSLPEAIPLTKGQKFNDLKQLRTEYQADKAVFGNRSKAAIDSINDAQLNAIERNIVGLNQGNVKSNREIGQEIGDYITSDYKKLKTDAKNLYNSSSAPLKSSSVKQSNYFDDVVLQSERELETFPMDVQDSFSKEIRRILKSDKKGKFNKDLDLDLQQIENLRKSLNREVFRNSQDKVRGAAASKLVNILDNAQDNWLLNKLVSGDDSSISAIRKARSKYAEIKKRYTGNSVSNDIKKNIIGVIENGDELAPESVFNAIYNFTKTDKASKGLKLLNDLGNINNGALKPVIKQGLFTRIYKNSLERNSDNSISIII